MLSRLMRIPHNISWNWRQIKTTETEIAFALLDTPLDLNKSPRQRWSFVIERQPLQSSTSLWVRIRWRSNESRGRTRRRVSLIVELVLQVTTPLRGARTSLRCSLHIRGCLWQLTKVLSIHTSQLSWKPIHLSLVTRLTPFSLYRPDIFLAHMISLIIDNKSNAYRGVTHKSLWRPLSLLPCDSRFWPLHRVVWFGGWWNEGLVQLCPPFRVRLFREDLISLKKKWTHRREWRFPHPSGRERLYCYLLTALYSGYDGNIFCADPNNLILKLRNNVCLVREDSEYFFIFASPATHAIHKNEMLMRLLRVLILFILMPLHTVVNERIALRVYDQLTAETETKRIEKPKKKKENKKNYGRRMSVCRLAEGSPQ